MQVNVKYTGQPPRRKFHIYNSGMKAICGYSPAKGATHPIEATELASDPEGQKMAKCKWCFKRYTWPADDWDPLGEEVTPDTEELQGGNMDTIDASGSSSSSSSSDSASDDGVELPEAKPPPMTDDLVKLGVAMGEKRGPTR